MKLYYCIVFSNVMSAKLLKEELMQMSVKLTEAATARQIAERRCKFLEGQLQIAVQKQSELEPMCASLKIKAHVWIFKLLAYLQLLTLLHCCVGWHLFTFIWLYNRWLIGSFRGGTCTPWLGKKDRQHFGHHFDKFKYITGSSVEADQNRFYQFGP